MVACGYAQSPERTEVYPVEEAFADARWTLLERAMPWGEVENIFIPSSWAPTALSDSDRVQVSIERSADRTVLTLERLP